MIYARLVFLLAASVAAASAFALPEIPKASARALGVTRSKPFSNGLVFINGKYIPPPYVVERWGTGIRINSKPVTGPLIPWSEFLKTQEGVKVSKSESAPASAAPAAPAAASQTDDVDDTSLDDLFDDDPKPKKKPRASTASAAHASPKTTVSYSLEGEFVQNAATKALVSRINAVRTEIDRILRNGGFICFGENYSRVSGDSRALLKMLEKLPSLQKRSETFREFKAGVRAEGLVYLNEILCEELFRNKVDYLRLHERYEKLKRDNDVQNMLKSISTPIL